MPKTIQYRDKFMKQHLFRFTFFLLICLTLSALNQAVATDAFDATVAQIKALEAELEQNQTLIEEQQTLIEEQLKTFRSNHELNAPKGEFESDADYAARIKELNRIVTQRRSELGNEHLSPLLVRRQEIQTDISRLSQRVFVTNDVTATLGRYNANDEYFPITFETNNKRVSVRLYISRQNDAPTLKENWDKVIKTARISIDPGYQRGIAGVSLEYPPLWEHGRLWSMNEVYHFGNNNRAVAFSSDGKYVATGSDKGYISIWDFSSGRELRQTEHSGTVYSVAFSPNGYYLAAGDSSFVRLLRVDNGKELWRRYVSFRGRYGNTYYANVYAVAFRPDGHYLASGTGRGINLNEVRSSNPLWGRSRIERGRYGNTYYANVYAVAFSPNGYYLATGDTFNDAVIWNANNGTAIHYIEHTDDVRGVDFSPDGRYLATGDNAGNVSICEVWSGVKLHELPRSSKGLGWVGAVVFSPDGKYLAVGYEGGYIGILRIPQGKLDIDSQIKYVKFIHTGGSVHELAWHPNGNFISDGRNVYRTLLQTETVNLTPPTPTLHIAESAPIETGTQFTLDLNLNDAFDLAGWQLDIAFNPAVLSVVEVKEGDFLKTGGGSTFFQGGSIDNTTGKVTGLSSAIIGGRSVSGAGTLFSITFEAKAAGEGQLQLHNTQLSTSSGKAISHELVTHPVVVKARALAGDVNQDKVVNIQDLVLVASSFGKSGQNKADVNGDGVVNIQDLVLVAGAFGNIAPAPSLHPQALARLTSADVQVWLTQARALDLTDATVQRGITVLEHLLATLTPKETVLLPNYPNPFNPETWIPYHLAQAADVMIAIYNKKGAVVRRLELGHQSAGFYTSRAQAAYWDGRTESGELVASGVYFYHLSAGEYSKTRRLVIVK